MDNRPLSLADSASLICTEKLNKGLFLVFETESDIVICRLKLRLHDTI